MRPYLISHETRLIMARFNDMRGFMNDATLTYLLGTAVLLGFFHTLTGPDHYVPFIAMSKIGRWSLPKTMIITGLCGIGHVLSSVVLGILGIVLGIAVGHLKWFEGLRGDVAGWLLLGFGLAYTIWGLHRAIRNRPHTHTHFHEDGIRHQHEHAHTSGHAHVHNNDETVMNMTPWILFTIFVFGPCEPLIPLLMYPAAKLSFIGVAAIAVVFSICTIGTMLTVVYVGYLGLLKMSIAPLARYSHALAGAALLTCGLAIQLGL